jgi:hypothetical protein
VKIVETLGAARRALVEAAGLLNLAAEGASGEWSEVEEAIRAHVETVDQVRQEVEMDLLAHAVLAILKEAGSARASRSLVELSRRRGRHRPVTPLSGGARRREVSGDHPTQKD